MAGRIALRMDEVAEELNISDRQVERLAYQGDLPLAYVRGTPRIPAALPPFERSDLPDDGDIVDINEAARLLSVSSRTVRRLISDGDLKAIKFGPRKTRLKVGDLQRLLGVPVR